MPPRRENKKHKGAAAAESGEDRISDLHDDLLGIVLSFLPAHEAMRTCMLSRRWREIWKSVRVLRFNNAESWGSPAKFNSFVNHLLFFRDLVPLEEFEFKTNLFRPLITSKAFSDSEEPVRYTTMWIRYAMMRGVQVLRVLVNSRDRNLLVNTPLISQHLRTLQLETAVLDGYSVDFSRCPALEDLEMRNCKIKTHKISFQSLRRLCVDNCEFTSEVCTRILAPNVLSLRLDVDSGRVPLLQSMPLLVKAYVRLGTYCRDRCWHINFGQCGSDTCFDCYGNRDGSDRCALLGGLSNATELVLAAHIRSCVPHLGVNIFMKDMQLCPTFSKLKNFVLDRWVVASEVHALIPFLQQAPILEKISLGLHEEREYIMDIEESCSLLERSFRLEHLKIIEVSCSRGTDGFGRVDKLVKVQNTCGTT